MDSAIQIAQSNAADVVLLRLESLDLLTHSRYGRIASHSQDNGGGALFAAYRYMDSRLGELHEVLDEDDTLVVVSDHGIETAMKHSREAFFVATGPGLPAGRAPGSPHFRGLAQVIATLAGVDTAWPETGILNELPSATMR
ncbi:MAG TPA: hypothetical protein DIU15_16100 [Deltaproteobacteria bacterium]|nr:hypothetical protein [Deltaproteobacteria bacterium]